MKKQTKVTISFSCFVVGYIFLKLAYSISQSKIGKLLFILGILFVSYPYYLLFTKTDFYKKKDTLKSRKEHRMKVFQELGLFKAICHVGYILSLLLMGIGIYVLFSNRPDKEPFSTAMFIVGSLMLLAFYLLCKKHNNKS